MYLKYGWTDFLLQDCSVFLFFINTYEGSVMEIEMSLTSNTLKYVCQHKSTKT